MPLGRRPDNGRLRDAARSVEHAESKERNQSGGKGGHGPHECDDQKAKTTGYRHLQAVDSVVYWQRDRSKANAQMYTPERCRYCEAYAQGKQVKY
jgi:hypothetical protein